VLWEDLTITLCGLGFGATLAVLVAELPAVIKPNLRWRQDKRPSS
jgi:hypothetical protein